jgi:hypothetical protein
MNYSFNTLLFHNYCYSGNESQMIYALEKTSLNKLTKNLDVILLAESFISHPGNDRHILHMKEGNN